MKINTTSKYKKKEEKNADDTTLLELIIWKTHI